MRGRTDWTRACLRCGLRRDACLCADVVRIENATQVLVLQHALESYKSTNTGRLATLALAKARLGLHGGREGDLDLGAVDLTGAAVLYPDAPTATTEVRTLVVLDGTWQQARRMLQRIDALRGLPRVSIPARVVEGSRLRKPHFDGGLSTIEAIAEALRVIEGDAPADALHALHRLFMARVRSTRGGPTPT